MRRKLTVIAIIALAAAGILAAAFGAKNKSSPVTAPSYKISSKYDSPQQFMQGIYDADHNAPSFAAKAAIVPHHLVAAKDIALGIKAIAVRVPKRVIMISPDHFDRCPTVLCSGNVEYATQLGNVVADAAAVKTLSVSPIVTVMPDLFQNEHGIYAVAPFVAHYLPGVTLTPIVVSSNHVWKLHQDEIAALVNSVIGSDDALIVSSDFSHYLSLGEANRFDEVTLNVLLNNDLDALKNLKQPEQSDCPACLWMISSLAKSRAWGASQVLIHTNSATILKDPSAESTTSHFTVIW